MRGRAGALSLPTASIDAVLFCELFEHLHLNPFHTLKEIFRVLRPGGLLVLTTPNLRRVETLSRLWHGWGTQPPVSRAFHELLPSLLYHRHNREYTADELAYYLALQGKDLYDFRLDRVYYSGRAGRPARDPRDPRAGAWGRELRLAGRLRRPVPEAAGPAHGAGVADGGDRRGMERPPRGRGIRAAGGGRAARRRGSRGA